MLNKQQEERAQQKLLLLVQELVHNLDGWREQRRLCNHI